MEIQESHSKEFKRIILKMLREQQDLVKLGKQYKKNKITSSTKRKHWQESNILAEEYNDWTEEFNRQLQ